jgi:KDO2-lipid IV(A) lauroyltransferase
MDILEIVVFKERLFASSRSYWACTIQDRRQKLRLTSAHRISPIKIEDRTSSYIPFIKEFESAALAANPHIRFIEDEYRETIVTKALGYLTFWLIKLLGQLTRKQAGFVCGTTLRYVGSLLRGNRHARRQLLAAYPSLSTRQVRLVLRDMWDNIGRTFAEYAHIRELMNFSTERPDDGQVVMDSRTLALVRQVGSEKRGALLFAAHLGNWEIPAMVARFGGRNIALVCKRQPSSKMTEQLVQIRSLFAARLMEATPSTPRDILKLLQEGWLVGMLMDQHFAEGTKVSFFGQTCLVNPILARLARTQNWPIYGARVVRLPDQRFRFELVGPLNCLRDQRGKIEVQSATQQIMRLIESWIREYPGQWMWIHRLIR